MRRLTHHTAPPAPSTTNGSSAQGGPDIGVAVAAQAFFLGDQRQDVADRLVRIDPPGAARLQHRKQFGVEGGLLDLAEALGDHRRAVDLDGQRRIVGGLPGGAQEGLGLLALPAGVHQLVHGAEGDLRDGLGGVQGIVAHGAAEDVSERPVAAPEEKQRHRA
jgi:hypothetical protein